MPLDEQGQTHIQAAHYSDFRLYSEADTLAGVYITNGHDTE